MEKCKQRRSLGSGKVEIVIANPGCQDRVAIQDI